MKKQIFLLIAMLLAMLFVFQSMGVSKMPTVVAVIAFFLAMGTSFVRGTDALYIIIFAMLFSPEVGSSVSTGRSTGEGAGLSVRLEDLLLIAVGIGWLLRTAYRHRHFGILRTPVNPAIAVYMVISIITTLLGVVEGHVKLTSGIFHNAKYFEYFFLYFMILAHVRKKDMIMKMITAILIVFFVACAYGYTQISLSGDVRVCAPFDEEPNTFGGYIVLIMCVIFGIILNDDRVRITTPLWFLMAFAFPPLLFTLSRASYMALVIGFMAFLGVSRHRFIVGAVTLAMVAIIILGIPMVPKPVAARIAKTFKKETQYHVKIGGIDLDASASARIVSYRQAARKWAKKPLLGYGVTGTHFIDSQYFRLLAETGLLGLGAFLFMIWRLLSEIHRVYTRCDDKFLKGVGMGLFCGIIAMLGHAVSANTFIIIRIAEPLWLLAGLIILLPRLEEREEDEAPYVPEYSAVSSYLR